MLSSPEALAVQLLLFLVISNAAPNHDCPDELHGRSICARREFSYGQSLYHPASTIPT